MIKKIILFIYIMALMYLFLLVGEYTAVGCINLIEAPNINKFGNNFLFSSFISNLYSLLIIMIPTLVISFLIRNKVNCHSMLKAGRISGFIAFGVKFVLLWTIGWAGGNWPVLLIYGFISFSIGFLLPILFRTYSHNYLLSATFY